MQRAVKDVLGNRQAPDATGKNVTIAIFDAWPLDPPDMGANPPPPQPSMADPHALNPLARIDAFVAGIGAGTNPRLEEFGSAGPAPRIPANKIYDYFSVYSTLGEQACATHATCDAPLQRPYDVSSHGLFIADIVTDIAPDADVRVYRVINNHGAGDAVSLVLAVESVLEEARSTPSQRFVLNLSLGIAVILSALQAYVNDPSLAFSDPGAWQSQVQGLGVLRRSPTRTADFQRKNDQLIADGLARMAIDPQDGDEYLTFTGMLGKFEYLFSGKTLPKNVLVVAASGNDSCAETLFEPRLPAAIEGVLGVAAVDAQGKQTPYSNLSDMVDVDEGIGAFGGLVNAGTLDSSGGFDGLFIGEFPPDNAAAAGANAVPNTYGTAQWSGTSFATPVVAAVAACVWSARRRLTGQQMIDEISLIGGRRRKRRRLRGFIRDPQTGLPLER